MRTVFDVSNRTVRYELRYGRAGAITREEPFVEQTHRPGDAVMVDLNTLLPPGSGWELQYGTAINDLGQLTG